MQTFLPYPNFAASAAVLDRARLGKQRLEAWQILQVLLSDKKTGWANHPAVLQWKGSEWWLAQYGCKICDEWIGRGYKDTMLQRFETLLPTLKQGPLPVWLFDEKFHGSHRSNLVRKDPKHYGPIFPSADPTLPYFWPVTK